MNMQVFLQINANRPIRARKINLTLANNTFKDGLGDTNNYGIRLCINSELCNGCKLCAQECSEKVLFVSKSANKKGFFPIAYTGSGCNGCGICVSVCPIEGALRIFRRVKPG